MPATFSARNALAQRLMRSMSSGRHRHATASVLEKDCNVNCCPELDIMNTTMLSMSKGSTCRAPNVVPIWGTLGLMSSFEVYCELVPLNKSTHALV